nr:hypothetical protein [Escherichia coli]
MNTPVGAFSVDVTHSNVSIPDDKTYQGILLIARFLPGYLPLL